MDAISVHTMRHDSELGIVCFIESIANLQMCRFTLAIVAYQ